MLKGFRILVFVVMVLFLLIPSVFSANRVYWDETKDTIYISTFPGRVNLHQRFDNDDTLAAMVHPFSWAGSSLGVSLVSKNCDNSGWFSGSAASVFDQQICRFDSPDKQMVNGLRFTCPDCLVPPGTNKLYAVWSFDISDSNSLLCLDSTFMTPSNRLKWINIRSLNIFPQSTKKCWVIAKSPKKCGDVNDDNSVNIGDIVYLINYIFYGGPPPYGLADVNGDGVVDIMDIVYLINYMFYGGPAPTC